MIQMKKTSIFRENERLYELLTDFCNCLSGIKRFQDAQCCINEFLSGEKARNHYEELLDLEDELHRKQHDGDLTEDDLARYRCINETLQGLPNAENFFIAQGELENIHSQIMNFIGMAIETGQIPTPEEIEELEHLSEHDHEHCDEHENCECCRS